MDTSPAQNAIALALSGKWNEAADVNLNILKGNPSDTEALCRLARAYSELGKISEAKEITNRVLAIDPGNQIATKFLEKLKIAKSAGLPCSPLSHNESFLEESGKTKLVQLMNLGEPENLVKLDPGEEVKLIPYSHRVSITTLDGEYVGRLPDDLAARLKNLIKRGNKYQTLIKSASPKEITIFIREIERGDVSDGSPSFPPEKIEYVSFTPPELVHRDIPSIEVTEEIPEE
jgi:tetratricopeptide (TPR) repeat protein